MNALGILLVLLGGLHCLLFFCKFLKLRFIELLYYKLGIDIGLFQIKWYKPCQNSSSSVVFSRNKLKIAWFQCGSWACTLLVVPATVFMVQNAINLAYPSEKLAGSIQLQPVVPGVNLPVAQMGYYLSSLFIVTVIHEAGHAWAAKSEGVNVMGYGILVLFAIPAAYVDIPTSELNALEVKNQLRIYSAGIWHNIALSLVAFATVMALPHLLYPLYIYQNGPLVLDVLENSPVSGPSGLAIGDIIESVNNCPVKSSFEWHQCIYKTYDQQPLAFCVSKAKIEELNSGQDCCLEHVESHNASACFFRSDIKKEWSACLPVRQVLLGRKGFCNDTCGGDDFCLRPRLGPQERLLEVKRRDKKEFLFMGLSGHLLSNIKTIDYAPRVGLLNPKLPYVIEMLAYYVTSFSAALALVNVIPCKMLDGEHLTRALIDMIAPSMRSRQRFFATKLLIIFGTSLLLLNISVAIIKEF